MSKHPQTRKLAKTPKGSTQNNNNTKSVPKGQILDLTIKQKKVAPKPLVRASKQELAYRIPECAEMYLSALVNPFDSPAGACIPSDLFPLPSSKTKTFVRGRMVVGLDGIGYVGCSPTLANSQVVVFKTTAATVGASNALFNTFAPISSTTLNSQLPYPASAFSGQQVLGRLVSYGLRIKYVGQLMSRNGVCSAYEDPDHQDCQRFSFDTLSANPYSSIERVGGDEWDATVNYSGPAAPSDVEFNSFTYPLDNAGRNMAIIAVSGIAGDIYEFEYYQHSEFIGQIVVNKTKSHADGPIFGKVLEAVKTSAAEGPISPTDGPSIWSKFLSYVSNSLPELIQVGVGVGNMLIGNEAGGAAMLLGAAGNLLKGGKPPDGLNSRRLTDRQKMIMA